MLSGVRAFPTGVSVNLAVRTRTRIRHFDLHEEVFDGPYRHDLDDDWRRDRFTWGFELADGRRATNVDPWEGSLGPGSVPDHPVLSGGGGGASDTSADRDHWLWPLPPAGPLTVACQWLRLGIAPTVSRIDGGLVAAAAARAQPVWP